MDFAQLLNFSSFENSLNKNSTVLGKQNRASARFALCLGFLVCCVRVLQMKLRTGLANHENVVARATKALVSGEH